MDLHQENPDESCRHERSVEAGMSLDINTKQARKRMASIDDANTTKTPVCSNGQWHVRVLKMLYLAR